MKAPLRNALREAHVFDDDFPYSVQGITRLKKLGYDPTKKEFCGCFTAVQILELMKLGIKPTGSYEHQIKWFKEKKKKGDMYRSWFYFYPSKEFLELKERVENESRG